MDWNLFGTIALQVILGAVALAVAALVLTLAYVGVRGGLRPSRVDDSMPTPPPLPTWTSGPAHASHVHVEDDGIAVIPEAPRG